MLATNIWTELNKLHRTVDLEPCSNCRTQPYDSTVVEDTYDTPIIHLHCEDCGQVDEFVVIQLVKVKDYRGIDVWVRPTV